MALNYWKLGGKPTSYNPLPIAWTGITIDIGDYVLSFRAKSLTLSKLKIWTIDGLFYQLFDTTAEFKVYSFTFSNKVKQVINFDDFNDKGDIIIEDVQLVQKPLPTLTINGIDGFNSGKWSAGSSIPSVISDEEVHVSTTGNNQIYYLRVNVIPNTNYVFNVEHSGRIAIYDNSIVSAIVPYTSNQLLNFNSGNNSIITIILGNSTLGIGKFTFKRPMLNLGTAPAPYEPKRGERMVLPSVKGKNLVQTDMSQWEGGGWQSSDGLSYGGTTIRLRYKNTIPIVKGDTYSISINSGYHIWLLTLDGTTAKTTYVFTDKATFVADGNNAKIMIRKSNDSVILPSDMVNVLPQLEKGQPTPYEPYAVQLNKKPKRYVPKKNLISLDSTMWESGTITSAGVLNNSATRIRTKDHLPIKPNVKITFSIKGGYSISINYYDISKNPLGQAVFPSSPYVFEMSNAYYVKLVIKRNDESAINPSDILDTLFQLEEGTTATPYEPYQLVLPRAKSGLAFNGVSDYLQLPSMTMDSVEIDCLIDLVQLGSYTVLDVRTGIANGYFKSGNTAGLKTTDGYSQTNDVPKNSRIKLKFNTGLFTDNINIFSNLDGIERTKGTLYKVTCYLNGNIVAHYDFENPQNIVGDKVLPNAKNLIPIFEDARWSLHPNFKVLGKDVGRLDATGAYQFSHITFAVEEGEQYLFNFIGSYASEVRREYRDVNGVIIGTPTYFYGDQKPVLIMPANCKQLYFAFRNGYGITTGSFDFIKPQLYELSGKEGTIVGKPTPLRKASKRTLYSKR